MASFANDIISLEISVDFWHKIKRNMKNYVETTVCHDVRAVIFDITGDGRVTVVYHIVIEEIEDEN